MFSKIKTESKTYPEIYNPFIESQNINTEDDNYIDIDDNTSETELFNVLEDTNITGHQTSILENLNNNEEKTNQTNYDKLLNKLFNIISKYNIIKNKYKEQTEKYKTYKYAYWKNFITKFYILLYVTLLGYLLFYKLVNYINNNCHSIIYNTATPKNIVCEYIYYDNNNFILDIKCNNNKIYNLTINNQLFDIYKYFIKNKHYDKIYECYKNNNLYLLNFNEKFNINDWYTNCIYNYNYCYNSLLFIIIGCVCPLFPLILFN